MHWSTSFTFVLLWLQICAAPAGRIEHQEDKGVAILWPRQQQATTKTALSDASTATTDNSAASTNTDTNSPASNTEPSISNPTTTVPSLNAATTTQTGQDDTSMYKGGLPIQPQITPALGVAGIILLLLGAILALVGVRKQWVQIFLSTAFIIALGVTVLIVYVMSPPVSNAVQGGYLIAVFFTGIIFGGLALVFREITEGLGCLLGGFCMAMWFLTLKSGGLVTSSGPKIGLIVAFAVAFYVLSFSHYTRLYGLIVCTAFSGATALVLGIDCYSRAGLKEFWLYIWDLNKKMLPMHTYTYPITRDIRVELAVIIIVTAMGVISQLRLWKVIQERRAKEENSRREEEKKKEAEEHEVGRRLEENNIKERAEWEHMYGNRHDGKSSSVIETVVDDSRGSGGFESEDREKDEQEGVIDMKDITSTDPSTEVSDFEKNRDAGDNETPDSGSGTWHEQNNEADQKSPEAVTTAIMPHFENMVYGQTALYDDDDDDDSEHGAVVGSDAGTVRSKRLSGNSPLNRLSWRSSNGANFASQTQSEEASLVPEDSNSSVAGVVDELGEPSSACPSIASGTQDEPAEENEPLIRSDDEGQNTQAISDGHEHSHERSDAAANTNTDELDCAKQPVQDAVEEGNDHQEHRIDEDTPNNKSTDQKTTVPENEHEGGASDIADRKTADEIKTKDGEELTERDAGGTIAEGPQEARSAAGEAKNDAVSTSQPKVTQQDEKVRLDTSTVKCIPEQTSKIVHSYRTQEWAKHLEDAEPPEVDPIQAENESQESSTEGQERAAPVDVEQLLQTPLNAQPPPAVTRSRSAEKNATSPDRTGRVPNPSPTPSHEIPRLSVTKARSPPSLSRASSAASMNMPRSSSVATPTHSPSSPYLTITGSGDDNDMKSPRRSGPPPLLAVRENMVRNRLSSTSLRYDPWASRSPSRTSMAESPTFSIPEEREEEEDHYQEDDDDVPLSKRRGMLQRQNWNSPSAASLQSLDPARSPSRAVDSNRSTAVMAGWRQSVRENIWHRRDPFSPPLAPSPDRPRSSWSSMQQMRDASATQLDHAIADGMQRGSMTDLHRQAMRRMQASVNRQLSLDGFDRY